MEFHYGLVTDVGTTRKVNQDSACIHFADTLVGEIIFAVVCDGMGGLSEGEYASNTMVQALEQWYENQLDALIKEGIELNKLRTTLEQVLKEHNEYLIQCGNEKNSPMGTTVSALLILQGRYFGIHVGDSRVYKVGRSKIKQITNDHSRVMQEVRLGIITPTEAERDSRKNQLLQCIGARGEIMPEFFEGNYDEKTTFLLCSDGFVHKISNKEIWKMLRPSKVKTEEKLNDNIKYLVEENKKRNETDNITALAIRVEP